jgi:NAD(P)H-dependent FMN reductase
MPTLQIIIGSTRPDRAADSVASWVTNRARNHPTFSVEVLDLRDWPLPFFAETRGTVGDFANPTYHHPIVKRWNTKVSEGDAYLFITPEYNHSIPAVLKNAIDSVFASYAFRNKPAAFVGYSAGIAAGVRAVEHLAHIAIEAELVPLRNSVLVARVFGAFDENGDPCDAIAEVSLGVLLDDLAWWATLLQAARADQLPPVGSRLQAAATSG